MLLTTLARVPIPAEWRCYGNWLNIQ